MQKRKIIGLVCTGLLAIVGLRVAISFTQFHAVEKNFAQVQAGQPRSSVIDRLGKPNYHEGKCGDDFSPPPNCAQEFAYSHPFAPLDPEYFVVWFSPDGRVILTQHRESPDSSFVVASGN
jgi:hypothetical protein